MNWKRTFAGIGILACLLYYVVGYNRGYELRPVIRVYDELVVEQEYDRALFAEQVVIVLERYVEPFKIDEKGRVLVGRELISDKDLVWNYTTKARNSTLFNSEGR